MPTSRGLRHAIVLATLIAGSPARGQELQELDTDRDAFTPATRPVAVGHVLTEASYSFIDNRGTPATNSFPELLIRRGATERFEWRLGFNYESGSGGSVVTAVEGGEGVEGDELASESKLRLEGVWITPIHDMDETWGFLIDDRRERLANDGLNRETCPLCGRLDNAKSPEQKRGVGILRSSMLKTKTLARELVPDRDIFVTDYTHSWFVKQSVLDVFGDELSSNKSVTLEQWSIGGYG